ncbi:MAG: DNA adenine methylase [Bacteroidales bacterium]|nr:DNA adenine methylase [Bacteroidales bacterium]
MYAIGQILRVLREEREMQLSNVQEISGIEMTLLSKIETGKRLPTIEQVQKLARIYDFDDKTLLIQRESDQILVNVKSPDIAVEALRVATDKLNFGEKYLQRFQEEIYRAPLALESRRYIGSKSKLSDWIMEIIDSETEGVQIFCDIFAGTGTIANHAIKKYDRVIINDFLYANHVIYKAFFGSGEWSKQVISKHIASYNSIDPDTLEDNFFSINFGDKYYDYKVSKVIGFIRDDIEAKKNILTEKEYNILLATLIYNIDKIANTVGHFEAYIKKPIKSQPLILRPIDACSFEHVEIYREDSNELAKKISCDLLYIDPPYNSRQYCRFYHLYETLVKWNKPKLFGVALKPAPENMSKYCSIKAVDAFRDLVTSIETKYIVVSYNNTYNSKSNSSENKIRLEEIKSILEELGETNIFDKSHRCFNAGKTEFDDHRELLFVTKKHGKKNI